MIGAVLIEGRLQCIPLLGGSGRGILRLLRVCRSLRLHLLLQLGNAVLRVGELALQRGDLVVQAGIGRVDVRDSLIALRKFGGNLSGENAEGGFVIRGHVDVWVVMG
jgi:hypothetical protein